MIHVLQLETEDAPVAQVKIFKSIETEVNELESKINEWLGANDVKVLNIFGNIAPQTIVQQPSAGSGRMFSPSDIMLVVLYE